MTDDNPAIGQADRFDSMEAPEPGPKENGTEADILELLSSGDASPSRRADTMQSALLNGILGYVNFDRGTADNTTLEAMASADCRKLFRREVYVCIKDTEQNIEFLGRIVAGPFHSPREPGTGSARPKKARQPPKRAQPTPAYDVYGTIEILGQLLNGESVIPTPTRPRPHSEIAIFPRDRLRKLLELEGNMLLGSLMGYEEQRVEVRIHTENKNILPLNVGIFGTVGSGKSNTVQVLVEEVSNANWACILIDVEGEYVKMNEPNDRPEMNRILSEDYSILPEGVKDLRVYVPSSGASDAENPSRFKVPISEFDISIVSDILEFSEPEFRMYGKAVDRVQRTGSPNRSSSRAVAGHPAQTSTYPYTLGDLIDILTSSAFYTHLDDVEKGTANTLRNKLFYTLGHSGMLDWTHTESTPYLDIDELLVGGRVSIFDVSETDDRSRNIAIAYILQSLFNRVTETAVSETMPDTDVLRPKVLVVIEEVHTFVSKQSVDKMKSVLDSLQTISRRGRKRWLSLALVSQQPGYLPEELFELANTRFIHQIKSVTNLAPVKQTTGGVHDALWSTIPALGLGQCLLTGRTFRNPLLIDMRPAKSKRLLTT